VIQVPNFGKRFWVYQIVDLRTDYFAELGAMYGTKPGLYLLAGPGWKGKVPKGIAKVFRAKTNTGFVVPRVFQEDRPEDNKAVQVVINGIDMYPLAMYDGKMNRRDWSKSQKFPAEASGESETKWVLPEKFVEQLPLVMNDAPPLPGEEARYGRIRAVLAAAQKEPALKQAMTDEATKTDKDVVGLSSSFATTGFPCRTTGVRRTTARCSARTISCAPRSRSRTSSSTSRTKQTTTIRTSTLRAAGSTARTGTTSRSRKARCRRCAASGRSRFTTSTTSSRRTT
jgi:hypothetical protein